MTVKNTTEEDKNKLENCIRNFDEYQKSAFNLIREGNNVLITGPAGTGKSFLLSSIRSLLKLPVTATTGIAAVNVQGQTINSWAGLGLGKDKSSDIVDRIHNSNENLYNKIKDTQQLAIDEISMMSAELFDKLEEVLRGVREVEDPFGGIQMILFGDFLQLPPVSRDKKAEFAFESAAWKYGNFKTIVLPKIHRQKDFDFAESLNQIRIGECNGKASSILNSCYKKKDENPDIRPIILHSRNCDVDEENNLELEKIDKPLHTFTATHGSIQGHYSTEMTLVKNCLAPEVLKLKEGAQVMLLWNLSTEGGLVNGSMGKVVGFKPESDLVYKGCPLVDFGSSSDLKGSHVIPVLPYKWVVTDSSKNNMEVAWYTQYPLKLAYSITIHKSQGMSLDKVQVNLEKCFAPGHAYVGLSRAKTTEGLFINSGNRNCINVDQKALDFYNGAHIET